MKYIKFIYILANKVVRDDSKRAEENQTREKVTHRDAKLLNYFPNYLKISPTQYVHTSKL